MGTAEQALDMARSYLGYREGPRNNETIFGGYTGYQYQPWCGSFVKFCLDKTGTTGEPSPVWTPAGVRGYQNSGRWLPRNSPTVQPGDVVFFDFGGSTAANATDHVGFVERLETSTTSGSVICIEGNTSPGNSGSQGNGGGVWRRSRPRSIIVGFGRPRYSAAPQPEKEQEEMNRLIDTPDGNTWLCSGAWRTKVNSEDANALQFIGTPRQKVDANFAAIIERTLADTAWCSTAAWYSKFGPVKS
jgi:hypothetical protein